MDNQSKSRKNFISFLLVFVLFGATFFLGYLFGHKNLVFSQKFIPKIVNLELGKPKDIDFSLFWNAWKTVQNNYVGEVDQKKMLYGSIKGMVDSLEDPYSVYLPPQEYKEFLSDIEGKYEGIGAEVTIKEGNLTILTVLDKSPAQKVGLRAKDLIVKIDTSETNNLSLDEAVRRIRGDKGTTLKLLIYREGWQSPKEFTLKREEIKVSSYEWQEKPDQIIYLKINQYNQDTPELLEKAAQEILKKNPKGIVVDLRNNPGGELDSAVGVTSLFIKSGSVVTIEENKNKERHELKTSRKPIFDQIKLVCLINEGSASGAEIMAGAFKDFERGKLIGKKTFGKGSVQQLEDLKEGVVKITVAKWLTPKGNYIDKVGISPDIEVDLTDQNVEEGKDPQLERALEELKK